MDQHAGWAVYCHTQDLLISCADVINFGDINHCTSGLGGGSLLWFVEEILFALVKKGKGCF